jgi:hypothetical protein
LSAIEIPLTLFRFESASANARLVSDWLQDQTTSEGPFPPIKSSSRAATFWRSSNCRALIRAACRSKPRKTRSASGDYDLNQRLHRAQAFGRPSEVLNDPDLTLNEKRTILASQASDACAIEAAPDLRSNTRGAPVWFDDIMAALRTLDRQANGERYRRVLHYRRGLLRREPTRRSNGSGALAQ